MYNMVWTTFTSGTPCGFHRRLNSCHTVFIPPSWVILLLKAAVLYDVSHSNCRLIRCSDVMQTSSANNVLNWSETIQMTDKCLQNITYLQFLISTAVDKRRALVGAISNWKIQKKCFSINTNVIQDENYFENDHGGHIISIQLCFFHRRG